MVGFFTVKGTRYELVPVEDWSFEEAAEFQRVAGMPVGRVMEGIADWDVNAYRGWFTICMQRANPSLSEQDLVGVNFVEAISQIEQVEPAEDPPPNPPTGSLSERGGNGGDPSASQQTPEGSGTRHGSSS